MVDPGFSGEAPTLAPTYFWLIIPQNLHELKKESTSFNVI